MKDKVTKIYEDKYKYNYNPIFRTGESMAQKYAIRLYDEIIAELKETGTCVFLQKYLKGLEHLNSDNYKEEVVTVDVLQSIFETYQSSHTQDYRYTTSLIYQNLPWNNCLGQEIPLDVSSAISLIHTILNRAKAEKNSIPITTEEPAKQEDTDTLEERKKQLDEREKSLDAISKELENKRKTAESEANAILKQAQAKADKIVKDAEKEAKEIQKNNDKEQERIQKNAINYFRNAHKDMRENIHQTFVEDINRENETKSLMYTQYEKMAHRVDELQLAYVSQIDEMMKQLEQQKAELYHSLHDWQTSLSPKRDRPIAERYVELYRLLNLDRIVAQEVEFQQSHGGSQDTVESLVKLEEKLHTFLSRYAKALDSLDFYVFIPEVGDIYDEYDMVCDQDDPYDRRIIKVITPGIKKRSGDAEFGDEIIVPAEVLVEE